MITTMAKIAEIELKSISAIVVAAIAGEWFPYDLATITNFFRHGSELSNRSDAMENQIKPEIKFDL